MTPRVQDRPRKIAFVIGIVLSAAGIALAVVAPEPLAPVPVAPDLADDAPLLTYVSSFTGTGEAPLVRPTGVTTGGGRIYVADSGAGVVRVFGAGGVPLAEIGAGVLDVPVYVAYEPDSAAILVSDRARGAVFRFDAADGSPMGEVRPTSAATSSWEPLGVAADGADLIAVTDVSEPQRVVVMDTFGEERFSLGGARTADSSATVAVALDYPNTVALTSSEIWVGDSNNRRVLVFDRDGGFDRLVRVDGVARGLTFISDVGATTHALVVDALRSELVVLSLDGDEAGRFGGPGGAGGQLAYPNDAHYDAASGMLYVADTGNARVQVWEVTPAEERVPTITLPLGGPTLSAMRLAGILLGILGAILTVVAVWVRPGGRDVPVKPNIARGGKHRRRRV